MAQKEPLLTELAVRVVAKYYWLRKWLGYLVVGLPGLLTIYIWFMLQAAQNLRRDGLWNSPPDFTKWWLGWALSLIIFLPGCLASAWFKAGDWAYKKSDFWGMEDGDDAT